MILSFDDLSMFKRIRVAGHVRPEWNSEALGTRHRRFACMGRPETGPRPSLAMDRVGQEMNQPQQPVATMTSSSVMGPPRRGTEDVFRPSGHFIPVPVGRFVMSRRGTCDRVTVVRGELCPPLPVGPDRVQTDRDLVPGQCRGKPPDRVPTDRDSPNRGKSSVQRAGC